MSASTNQHEPPKKKQKVIKSINLKTSTDKRLIVVLENASLESVKVSISCSCFVTKGFTT